MADKTKPKPKKPVTAKTVMKPKAAKPKAESKLEGLSRARAMARKRGYNIRTDRENPGEFKLVTEAVVAEGSVSALIEYMRGGDDDAADQAKIDEVAATESAAV